MNIKPLYNRVLVEKYADQEETEGGLLLSEGAKVKSIKAKVVAVADAYYYPTGETRQMQVRVGQTVLVSRFGGDKCDPDEDDRHFIFDESDILGIVEDTQHS